MKISNKKMLTGWIAGAFFIAFTSVALAGSIEPPSDAVDSSGAPKSTMKTMDNIPGSWDRLLDSTNGDPTTGCNSDRFTCIFPGTNIVNGLFLPDGVAVRDNETGLVWERVPTPITTNPNDWGNTANSCRSQKFKRGGWRLPYVEELQSLTGRINHDRTLPSGHPFLNVSPTAAYWTATTDPTNSNKAWAIKPLVDEEDTRFLKSVLNLKWCVRGPVTGTP